ncbi:MAG: (2Fe-2S)-binding protein [Hyphomicrobiales bacterium]|nr:(2Fe-2S)-binding protein [Hyphomicrobiales bacterium]MCC7480103.1 (2Fe-2S)-binding protein [Hyphomicrobiales bacterium]
METSKAIKLKVNGKQLELLAAPNSTLLEILRNNGHVEVKCGCEKGDCGACAVILDGEAVDSCLTLAWIADGSEVQTVKGIGTEATPHPLQTAFIEEGSVQCGYCIPGIIVAAKVLLDENPDPTDSDIRVALSGNLCRCTGYTRIFSAIHKAAQVMREGAQKNG